MALKIKHSIKLKTAPRIALVAGGMAILTFAAYLLFVINSVKTEYSMAGNHGLMENDDINNGEIINSFSWDKGHVLEAETGNNALSISNAAQCLEDGTDSTSGLCAGNLKKDINMILFADELLNKDGIDISLDYKRLESSANFYTRGNDFNFGMKNGIICIKYRVTTQDGKSYIVDQSTGFELTEDNSFRNVRFIYNPNKGLAQIYVDRVTVWSNQAPERSKLTWEVKSSVIIGQGMNGSGKPFSTIDNLVIRQCGGSAANPIELLSFISELQGDSVVLTWNTAKEFNTEKFIIERSTDTKSYDTIGSVKAAGNSNTLKSYALADHNPYIGISYYRLSLSNSHAKSVWMPVIALRLKPENFPNYPSQASGVGLK